VVIVNQAFARANWPDGDVLGKRIRTVRGESDVLQVI